MEENNFLNSIERKNNRYKRRKEKKTRKKQYFKNLLTKSIIFIIYIKLEKTVAQGQDGKHQQLILSQHY